jgi:hypothetical protein
MSFGFNIIKSRTRTKSHFTNRCSSSRILKKQFMDQIMQHQQDRVSIFNELWYSFYTVPTHIATLVPIRFSDHTIYFYRAPSLLLSNLYANNRTAYNVAVDVLFPFFFYISLTGLDITVLVHRTATTRLHRFVITYKTYQLSSETFNTNSDRLEINQ